MKNNEKFQSVLGLIFLVAVGSFFIFRNPEQGSPKDIQVSELENKINDLEKQINNPDKVVSGNETERSLLDNGVKVNTNENETQIKNTYTSNVLPNNNEGINWSDIEKNRMPEFKENISIANKNIDLWEEDIEQIEKIEDSASDQKTLQFFNESTNQKAGDVVNLAIKCKTFANKIISKEEELIDLSNKGIVAINNKNYPDLDLILKKIQINLGETEKMNSEYEEIRTDLFYNFKSLANYLGL